MQFIIHSINLNLSGRITEKNGVWYSGIILLYLYWSKGIILIPSTELVEIVLAAGDKTEDSVKPAFIKQKSSAHTNPHLHV